MLRGAFPKVYGPPPRSFSVRRVGGKVRVRTAGGRVRVLSEADYRRIVGRSGRHLAAREREARRQGFASAGQQALTRRAGRQVPRHFRVAGVSGPGLKGFLSRRTLVGAAGPAVAKLGQRAVTKAAHDAISLPANVVVGAYVTGRGVYKATPVPGVKRSDTSELKEIAKQFMETDPLALAAQGRIREALKQFGEHPVATSLEAYGGAASVSRVGGRATRRVSGGRVASRSREARRLPGTRLAEPRVYSPGLVGKAGQRAVERARVARSRNLSRKAAVAEREGRGEAALKLRQAAGRADPTRMPERYIARRMDLQEGLHQSVRRPHRAQTAKASRAPLREPKHGRELISLMAQHIVDADPKDLRAFRQEMAGEFAQLDTRAKRGANKRMRRQVDRALSGKADLGELERAARAYAKVQKPLEDEVVRAGMLDRGEAEKAKVKGYAQRRMGARDVAEVGLVSGRHVGRAQRLVKEIRAVRASRDLTPREKARQVSVLEGRRKRLVLQTDEIHAHMRGRGIDPASTAFVPWTPRRGGGGAFNVSFREPRGIPKKRRTGKGLYLQDLHPERLVEQNVKLRGMFDATERYRGNLSQIVRRDRHGKITIYKSRSEGQRVADDLMFDEHGEPIPGAHAWRVVRVNPWHGREAQMRKTLERADDEGYLLEGKAVRHPVNEAIEEALQGKGPDDGEWAIIPEAAAARLEQHAGVYRGVGPTGRAITQAFRRTVLPLSPSWLAGNVIEGAMRTAVARAGPRSWVARHRVYSELARKDPKAAEEFLHSIPGGHFGGTHEQMTFLSADQFADSRMAPMARALERLGKTPGPKHIAGAYRRYSDFVFNTMNASVEAQFTRAMAGRHLIERGVVPKAAGRPVPKFAMTPRMRETVQRAVEQGAWGVRNTNEQAAMGEAVRRAYGAYESHPPALRRMILTYTPFLPWTLNAIKFLGVVLPRDHPTLTALAAANHQLTEEWRNAHGLDLYTAVDPLPPFLQGSIPTKGGGHSRAPRYTPFGFATDPAGTAAGLLLPQVSGGLMALRGLDWKGDPIKENGKPVDDPAKLSLYAARAFIYATVPGIGLGARLKEKGPKALNPLEPVAPKKSRGGGGPKSVRDEFENFREKSADNAVRSEFEKFKQGR